MPLPCCLHKERGLVQMHTTALERDLTMRIRCCAVQQPGGGGRSAHSCAGGGLALRAVSQLGGPGQRSAAIGPPAVGCEVSLSGLSCCVFSYQSPLLRTSDLIERRHCAAMRHLLHVPKDGSITGYSSVTMGSIRSSANNKGLQEFLPLRRPSKGGDK